MYHIAVLNNSIRFKAIIYSVQEVNKIKFINFAINGINLNTMAWAEKSLVQSKNQ